jgi:hypothetical protein
MLKSQQSSSVPASSDVESEGRQIELSTVLISKIQANPTLKVKMWMNQLNLHHRTVLLSSRQ